MYAPAGRRCARRSERNCCCCRWWWLFLFLSLLFCFMGLTACAPACLFAEHASATSGKLAGGCDVLALVFSAAHGNIIKVLPAPVTPTAPSPGHPRLGVREFEHVDLERAPVHAEYMCTRHTSTCSRDPVVRPQPWPLVVVWLAGVTTHPPLPPPVPRSRPTTSTQPPPTHRCVSLPPFTPPATLSTLLPFASAPSTLHPLPNPPRQPPPLHFSPPRYQGRR